MSAVRKALEAACRTDGLYGIKPEADADIRRDRADAIAAFLRNVSCRVKMTDGTWSDWSLESLAAAVEAAAREGA